MASLPHKPRPPQRGRHVLIRPGERYGSWTVLAFSHKDRHGRRFVLCRCDCGTEYAVALAILLRGESNRCRACLARYRTKHGAYVGNKPTAEYKAWQGMRQRCENPHNAAWEWYGGRGIRVCEQWQAFEQFLADMGPRPSSRHSLDRIDPEGHYEPDNVRWGSTTEQGNNKRDTVRYPYQGESRTLAEWARHAGIPIGRLRVRVRLGWSLEQALTIPPQKGPCQKMRNRIPASDAQ